MPSRILLWLIFLFGSLPSAAVRAVVVAESNSPTETQAPITDDFGFASVGTVFNSIAGIPASGVYLGDGWILSAYHNVTNGSGGFTFGGVTLGGLGYIVDTATANRLHNPDLSFSDLAIFRLTAIPAGVPAVNLAGIAPSVGASVTMMGNGQDRSPTETNWLVVGGTWTEVAFGGNRSGYELVGTRSMRWGTNTIETAPVLTPDFGFGKVVAFTMDFDDVSGQAMATGGDSGGGVFTYNGSAWELAGIMVTVDKFAGQPAGTVVYGNSTYATSVASYKAEIVATMAAVPEPSASMILLTSSAWLLRRRRSAR